MDDSTPLPEQQDPDAPLIPSEPAPPIHSRFLFVDVAALRAKQLRRGARPRLGEDVPQLPHKAERVAMEEVRRGLVYYDVRPVKRPDDGGAAALDQSVRPWSRDEA
jgi:DNA-directed RNA polymerase subunit K/omega